MYKRQIYQIVESNRIEKNRESNRIESKLFCPNWNALTCRIRYEHMKFVYVDIFGIIHIMIVIEYIYYAAETAFSAYCLECFDTVGWHQEEQPACKN